MTPQLFITLVLLSTYFFAGCDRSSSTDAPAPDTKALSSTVTPPALTTNALPRAIVIHKRATHQSNANVPTADRDGSDEAQSVAELNRLGARLKFDGRGRASYVDLGSLNVKDDDLKCLTQLSHLQFLSLSYTGINRPSFANARQFPVGHNAVADQLVELNGQGK